ncbi:MAG: 3-hydroxyacyl-CoA dehydrogenase family protein [Planctomycetota bacterium]
MTVADIQRVGVIGTGTMGNGIAQVFAQTGVNVVMVDITREFIDRALTNIDGSLQRLVKKEKMTADEAATVLGRIKGTTSLDDTKDVDFVVEAVTENITIKREIHARLGQILREGVIISSNTSSIPITDLAKASGRPTHFIGMHFMNPVPVMKLVEVIRGYDTTDETTKVTCDLATRLGKTPVEVHDFPGFAANRVLMPLINEAIFALFEGVGTVEAIDQVCKLGLAHPMGPLQLADFIGLDVCLAIMKVLHDGFGDPKFRPCPLLVKLVTAGHLGDKTGRGFYTWEGHKVTGVAYNA